jgi:signal peptidase II
MSSCLPWAVCLFIFLLDQLTKLYISRTLALGQSIPVIKNIFHISPVHNTGIAFGLLKNHNTLFIILSFAVILYIGRFLLLRRRQFSAAPLIAFGLILGGACGNLVDRIRLGYIVDFLDFRIWPVFNIADSAITVGIVLLGIELLITNKSR